MHWPYVLVATRSPERAARCRETVVSLGFDVQVAHDGPQAAQTIARDGEPLLLITDDSVAGIDGTRRHELRLQPNLAAAVAGGPGDGRGSGLPFAAAAREAEETDPAGLRTTIQQALDRAALEYASSSTSPTERPDAASVEDALHRAVAEASRSFQLPVCIAYASIDGREHIASHLRIDARANATVAPLSVAVLRDMAASGEPLILPDLGAGVEAAEFARARFDGFRGIAGMPIAYGHPRRSGLLCLLDTQPLTLEAADLDRLGELARAVGQHLEGRPGAWASIEGTREADEFETLERLAVTDPLTGLANRRGGDQNIAAEISRAKRQQTPISCILLDVDRFKMVNDTYGHQAGDFLLREFGALLRRTLRAYDILVRWGGEEFLIVLPGVSLDVARGLAERIRRAVEQLAIQGVGSVSVSAGVASIGENYDFEAMLAQADRQLYHAKASGRNRVA